MIGDAIELDFLSQLQAKRSAELRVQTQQNWGLTRLMNRMIGTSPSTPNSTTTALDVASASTPSSVDTPTLGGGLGAMVNRSPTTINNYYPQAADPVVQPAPTPPIPTPAPAAPVSPWWLMIPLVAALAGATTYLLWPKPTPVIPPAPTKPGGESADTTIQLRDWPK